MNKYKLTDETLKIGGNVTLHRIEALVDIESKGVKAGDKGGWIEKEDNLSQDGDAWVSGNAMVHGHAEVRGNARVFGLAEVYGRALVFGNALVFDNALVAGNAEVYDNACVYGRALVFGNAEVFGRAWVSNRATVIGDAKVFGNESFIAGYIASADTPLLKISYGERTYVIAKPDTIEEYKQEDCL